MHGEVSATEKNCLNCGTTLDGPFCKNCGQIGIVEKESTGHLLLHFIQHFFHYDGKTFNTIRLLLTKPGALSTEYKKGVRIRYVDPFNLYLFVSAMVFVVFLALERKTYNITKISNPEVIHLIDSTRIALRNDTAFKAKLEKKTYSYWKIKAGGQLYAIFDVKEMLRHGKYHYDSVQRALGAGKRSKGFQRYTEQQVLKIYEVYDTAPYNFYKKAQEKANLNMPKSFFVSIPIFIIFLLILYLNKRKAFQLIHHIVFAMHFYTTVWIFIMLDSIVCYILEHTGLESIEDWVAGPMYLALIPYFYIAALKFYREHWILTLVKVLVILGLFASSYFIILNAVMAFAWFQMGSVTA